MLDSTWLRRFLGVVEQQIPVLFFYAVIVPNHLLAEFSAEEATLRGVLDPPNHLRNHAKLPHSSLDSQDKQGNSFPAELINSKTFAESSSSFALAVSQIRQPYNHN
jgi:hypothetical protein